MYSDGQIRTIAAEVPLHTRTIALNIAVEEENLATVPFAILERRVGKKTDKIEVRGYHLSPDGTKTEVTWEVQGSAEFGLPTEKDLDVFVALGVLTLRANCEKTIYYTAKEIAEVLKVSHRDGRFHRRLKLAMNRLHPLQFRALTTNERRETVKWRHIFQDADYVYDKVSGRCIGTVTWTDKLIASMDAGFFRLLDADRYMELDGLTAKYLYRFLTSQFEVVDTVVMDAREVAQRNAGIITPPKHLSRLMQTLEPAFEQLREREVLASWHIVDSKAWRIAMTRHPSYIPERKRLMDVNLAPSHDPIAHRAYCQTRLEEAGLTPQTCKPVTDSARTSEEFYQLERAANILQAMQVEGVALHVALSLTAKAVQSPSVGDLRTALDRLEIAIDVCRDKKASRQSLANPAGLIVKIAKDEIAQKNLVHRDVERSLLNRYRRREEAALRQWRDEEARSLVVEYEEFRWKTAEQFYRELPEDRRNALKAEKRNSSPSSRSANAAQQHELENSIIKDMEREHVPPFERWLLRQRVQRTMFGSTPSQPLSAQ
jgi:signal recognition particle subunit SEC65